METNKVFFADNGLTSTSANHIANLAKEYVQGIEQELKMVRFYNSEVALIGTKDYNTLSEGLNDNAVYAILEKLEMIAKANSLIAWLREAIKAKEALLSSVRNMNFDKWCNMFGWEIPVCPECRNSLTKEEVISSMGIKERNRMLSLQAKCAVLGKYIHPDGAFSEARRDYNARMVNRHEVRGDGRDTLIYKYEPTCNEDVLEDMFFELQKQHREAQAELNGILHDIDEKVRADQALACQEYNIKYSDYTSKRDNLVHTFEQYKLNEEGRIANKYKIAIPNALQDIYDKINSLGK